MKRIAGAAILLLAGVLSVSAQTSPPGQTPAATPPASAGPGNKAVNAPDTQNPGAPVAGANSFTEGQAKSRIEGQGFKDVTGLKKDDNGIWRATASKDGRSHQVSLDFQGNVTGQ